LHTPALHVCPTAQALPQAPQLLGLLARFTQPKVPGQAV
jgi:hypothetical protein